VRSNGPARNFSEIKGLKVLSAIWLLWFFIAAGVCFIFPALAFAAKGKDYMVGRVF
jgi:hypothetical protein